VKAKFVKSALFMALLSIGNPLLAADQKVPEQTWTLSSKESDIVEVAKVIQEVIGKPMIVDPKVRGPIKLISSKPLNKKELYELFLAVLDVHGFTAVESEGIVRIIANRDARQFAIPTEQAIKDKDDGYITSIIQLNNISAAKVLAALRPLVPQYGHLTAYEPSNALIISDTRANIARINDLIEQMDKAAVLAVDVLQMRYAQATDVVAMINQLEKPDPNRGVTTSPPIIVADKRINAVIVSGDEMSRQRIKGVVESLDRPQTKNSNVRVIYLKYAKAADVAKVLTGMLQGQGGAPKPADGGGAGGQANVQADEATNSVLITADNDTAQSLLAVVDSLDIRRAQVLVEAIIVEITDGAGKNLGVEWMYANKTDGFGGFNGGNSNLAAMGAGALALKDEDTYDTGLDTLAKALSATAGNTFGVARLGENTSFVGLLNMLNQSSSANVLSTPNLLTTDNTKAHINVGQSVPIKSGSYTGSTTGTGSNSFSSPFNTYQREKVGVSLDVTPHINEGDRVVLDIKQKTSGVVDKTNPDGIITSEREIETQILLADGQTVVLGGLIQDNVSVGVTKVPLLGSIPLVGKAFRTEKTTKEKTNLLVFIRATVIRDDEVLAGATAEKYQYIRDTQLENRRKLKEYSNSKSIPVVPEWKDHPLPEEKTLEKKLTPDATTPAGDATPVITPIKSE
jgi:general secretion pathway protein D